MRKARQIKYEHGGENYVNACKDWKESGKKLPIGSVLKYIDT